MTPKEKANYLANLFITKSIFDMDNDELKTARIHAKDQSTACVNEIIKSLEEYGDRTMELQNMDREFAWWDKVLEEIKSL